MHPMFKNVLAVILGWLSGSVINIGLLNLGHSLYPIEGVTPSEMQALAEIMPTLGPEYFIFPLLAHTTGSFLGGLIACLLGSSSRLNLSMAVGFIFFLGGMTTTLMLNGPLWFTITDLALAYLPMAWLGYLLGMRLKP